MLSFELGKYWVPLSNKKVPTCPKKKVIYSDTAHQEKQFMRTVERLFFWTPEIVSNSWIRPVCQSVCPSVSAQSFKLIP